jgi:hypothetical protein
MPQFPQCCEEQKHIVFGSCLNLPLSTIPNSDAIQRVTCLVALTNGWAV